MNRFLLSIILFAAPIIAAAQPTPAQLDRIAASVEAGNLAEAKIRTETLLEVYPGDLALNEIQRLLREKHTTPPSSAPLPAPVAPPAPPAPVPKIPRPSLNAWLGDWTAEATVDTALPPSGQIEEQRHRVQTRVTLTVQPDGNNATITLHGECRDDYRSHFTDGKSAFHVRRHVKYDVPGRLTTQDITVSNTGEGVSLRDIDFEEAARVMIKPTYVAKMNFYEKYILKRHAFSNDYTTLTLWIGATDNYEGAKEVEVTLEFTLNPVAESLTLSVDACLSFTQYTKATVPSIIALEKVKPFVEAKP